VRGIRPRTSDRKSDDEHHGPDPFPFHETLIHLSTIKKSRMQDDAADTFCKYLPAEARVGPGVGYAEGGGDASAPVTEKKGAFSHPAWSGPGACLGRPPHRPMGVPWVGMGFHEARKEYGG